MEAVMKVLRGDEQIIQEVEASIRLRDIKEWNDLQESLAPTFTEYGIRAVLFTLSLGLILTLIFVLPQENETAYYLWLFWGCGTLLAFLFTLDYMLRKFRVMRRVIEIQNQCLEVYDKVRKIQDNKKTVSSKDHEENE
jgi:hypothetical protein